MTDTHEEKDKILNVNYLTLLKNVTPSTEFPNLRTIDACQEAGRTEGGELECNELESSPKHSPPLVHGKIVFQETGPWCQKGWGPLPQQIEFTNTV